MSARAGTARLLKLLRELLVAEVERFPELMVKVPNSEGMMRAVALRRLNRAVGEAYQTQIDIICIESGEYTAGVPATIRARLIERMRMLKGGAAS